MLLFLLTVAAFTFYLIANRTWMFDVTVAGRVSTRSITAKKRTSVGGALDAAGLSTLRGSVVAGQNSSISGSLSVGLGSRFRASVTEFRNGFQVDAPSGVLSTIGGSLLVNGSSFVGIGQTLTVDPAAGLSSAAAVVSIGNDLRISNGSLWVQVASPAGNPAGNSSASLILGPSLWVAGLLNASSLTATQPNQSVIIDVALWSVKSDIILSDRVTMVGSPQQPQNVSVIVGRNANFTNGASLRATGGAAIAGSLTAIAPSSVSCSSKGCVSVGGSVFIGGDIFVGGQVLQVSGNVVLNGTAATLGFSPLVQLLQVGGNLTANSFESVFSASSNGPAGMFVGGNAALIVNGSGGNEPIQWSAAGNLTVGSTLLVQNLSIAGELAVFGSGSNGVVSIGSLEATNVLVSGSLDVGGLGAVGGSVSIVATNASVDRWMAVALSTGSPILLSGDVLIQTNLTAGMPVAVAIQSLNATLLRQALFNSSVTVLDGSPSSPGLGSSQALAQILSVNETTVDALLASGAGTVVATVDGNLTLQHGTGLQAGSLLLPSSSLQVIGGNISVVLASPGSNLTVGSSLVLGPSLSASVVRTNLFIVSSSLGAAAAAAAAGIVAANFSLTAAGSPGQPSFPVLVGDSVCGAAVSVVGGDVVAQGGFQSMGTNVTVVGGLFVNGSASFSRLFIPLPVGSLAPKTSVTTSSWMQVLVGASPTVVGGNFSSSSMLQVAQNASFLADVLLTSSFSRLLVGGSLSVGGSLLSSGPLTVSCCVLNVSSLQVDGNVSVGAGSTSWLAGGLSSSDALVTGTVTSDGPMSVGNTLTVSSVAGMTVLQSSLTVNGSLLLASNSASSLVQGMSIRVAGSVVVESFGAINASTGLFSTGSLYLAGCNLTVAGNTAFHGSSNVSFQSGLLVQGSGNFEIAASGNASLVVSGNLTVASVASTTSVVPQLSIGSDLLSSSNVSVLNLLSLGNVSTDSLICVVGGSGAVFMHDVLVSSPNTSSDLSTFASQHQSMRILGSLQFSQFDLGGSPSAPVLLAGDLLLSSPSSNLSVSQNLTIAGPLSVAGNVTLPSAGAVFSTPGNLVMLSPASLTVQGPVTVQQSVYAADNVTFSSGWLLLGGPSLKVGGDLAALQSLYLWGPFQPLVAGSYASVRNSSVFQGSGTLVVRGATFVAGNFTSLSSMMSVAGRAYFLYNLYVSGAQLQISSGVLQVLGSSTTFTGPVEVTRTASVYSGGTGSYQSFAGSFRLERGGLPVVDASLLELIPTRLFDRVGFLDRFASYDLNSTVYETEAIYFDPGLQNLGLGVYLMEQQQQQQQQMVTFGYQQRNPSLFNPLSTEGRVQVNGSVRIGPAFQLISDGPYLHLFQAGSHALKIQQETHQMIVSTTSSKNASAGTMLDVDGSMTVDLDASFEGTVQIDSRTTGVMLQSAGFIFSIDASSFDTEFVIAQSYDVLALVNRVAPSGSLADALVLSSYPSASVIVGAHVPINSLDALSVSGTVALRSSTPHYFDATLTIGPASGSPNPYTFISGYPGMNGFTFENDLSGNSILRKTTTLSGSVVAGSVIFSSLSGSVRTEILRIYGNNNYGTTRLAVGLTGLDPAYDLDVSGSVEFQNYIQVDSQLNMYATMSDIIWNVLLSGTTQKFDVRVDTHFDTIFQPALIYEQVGGTGAFVFGRTSPIAVPPAVTSSYMTIRENGQVGINTDAPTSGYQMDVIGNVRMDNTGTIDRGGLYSLASSSILHHDDGGGGATMDWIWDSANSAYEFYVNSGSLGLWKNSNVWAIYFVSGTLQVLIDYPDGSSLPTSRRMQVLSGMSMLIGNSGNLRLDSNLHLTGTSLLSSAQMSITHDASSNVLFDQAGSTQGWSFFFDGSNFNSYVDTTNQRFGIGTQSPSNNLHVVGDTFIQSGNLIVGSVAVGGNIASQVMTGDDGSQPGSQLSSVRLLVAAGHVNGGSFTGSGYAFGGYGGFSGPSVGGTQLQFPFAASTSSPPLCSVTVGNDNVFAYHWTDTSNLYIDLYSSINGGGVNWGSVNVYVAAICYALY